MTSAGYRIMDSWERSDFRLNGNTRQTFIWTESISEVEEKIKSNRKYFEKQTHGY